MKQRLMGLETEYAFTVTDREGIRLDPEEYTGRLMAAARRQLLYLPGCGSNDLYLASGARFYLDCGLHPEWDTPEVTNPWDAVRYLKAGNQALAELVSQLEQDRNVGEVVMGRCNVSYGCNATWGRHESYSYQGSMGVLAQWLIPFLVARVIYHGAGGFTSSPGAQYTLSPRCFHIVHAISGDSTRERAIFHTKQESLNSGGYSRVHILCGDSLCSDRGNLVTIGATALVIALVEAGIRPGQHVQLAQPVSAFQQFAMDPTCRTSRAALKDGGWASALEIQRRYCDCVGAHLDADSMPEWAPALHVAWAELLDALDDAPRSVEQVLDAPMKLAVFKNHAKRRSFDWSQVEAWNLVLDALRQRDSAAPSGVLSLGTIRNRYRSCTGQVARMRWFMERRFIEWNQFDAFLDLCAELQEIDQRWTQLGQRGIFGAIERQRPDALNHQVPGIDRIHDACVRPPGDTRAAVRGACVRDLASGRHDIRCSWEYVADLKNGRVINMGHDPFATTQTWEPATKETTRRLGGLSPDEHIIRERRERIRALRREARRQTEPGETAPLPF